MHLPFVIFQRGNISGFKLPVEILTGLMAFVGHAKLGINALAVFDSSVFWVIKIRAMFAKIPNALKMKFVSYAVYNVMGFLISNNRRND